MEKDVLLEKLNAFPFDHPGAPRPFSRRLAKEYGWDTLFALRAIAEYRKFLFLTQISGGRSVSPSRVVDHVWHLHLSYTKSYWNELCRDIFSRPLHHEPTDGKRASTRRFRSDYQFTLDLYASHFGEPPADIWPGVDDQFRPVKARWIELDRYLLLRMPKRIVRILRKMKRKYGR